MLVMRESLHQEASERHDLPASHVPVPVDHADLFPYQDEGARWLATKRRALLADHMGLGKTAQAIRACDLVGAKTVLILAPAVARMIWSTECMKFSIGGCRSLVPVLSSKSVPSTTNGLVISYDLILAPTIFTSLVSRSWDVIIADESHYLNGTDTKRTKAVLGKGGLIHQARYFWALSGTPARNHAGELWALLYVCGCTDLKRDAFIDRFCRTIRTPYEDQKVVGHKHEAEFRALIEPFMLRRRKEDVLKDLPPILYTDVPVEPAPVDMQRWYHDVLMGWVKPEVKQREISEELFTMGKTVDLLGSGSAADALAGLGQRCELSRRYVGLSKCPPVIEIIRTELEANAYPKIVLFGWHKDVLKWLQEAFRMYHAQILWGQSPPIKRDQMVRKFQRDPRMRVIVCNVQAAGTAITLTAAHEVGIVESTYVPSDMAQAIMRVHRIGQTQPVRVRWFNAAGTVDESIQRIIRRKTKDLVEMFDKPHGEQPKAIINPFEE